MNEVSVFEKEEFGKIRTIIINNIPYFVGKDVADALGYEAPRNALLNHVLNEDKLMHQISASGQRRNMTIINESGLYSLILSSKLKSAQDFKHWVTSEVLPQIRKTGKYKGKSPIAIECSKKRNLFTQTLQEHGIEKPYEYANITIAMKEPFGLDGIKKKDMPDRDKLKIAAAETLATAMLYNEIGYTEVKPVCVDASETVNNALNKRITA